VIKESSLIRTLGLGLESAIYSFSYYIVVYRVHVTLTYKE